MTTEEACPLEGVDKGFHKGVQTRHDLFKDIPGATDTRPAIGFCDWCTHIHGELLLGLIRFSEPQKGLIYNGLSHVNPEDSRIKRIPLASERAGKGMVANPVAIRFVLAEHIHHNAELLAARFKAKDIAERILMAPVEVNLISKIEVWG